MELQGLHGLPALVQIPSLRSPVPIKTAFSFLLRALGVPKDTPRKELPPVVSVGAAVSLLQLLSANLPEDVDLHEAAAAMSATPVRSYNSDVQVQLDALLGLACLLSGGSTQEKLQLCFWSLDRDSSGSLDLQQLLSVIPAAQLTAAAARIILQEATLQSLADQASDPHAAADSRQTRAVLQEVLSRAFKEADPQGRGLITPGEQMRDVLFAAAAQLTSIMLGASPLSQNTGSSRASSVSLTPPRSLSPFRQQQQQHTERRSPQQQQQQQQQQQDLQQQQQQGYNAATSSQPPQQQPQQQERGAAVVGAQVDYSRSSTAHTSGANTLDAMSTLSCELADVVIMDGAGGMLHYTAPVHEAAAAACQGRAPMGVGSSGALRAYAPAKASRGGSRSSVSSMGGTTAHTGLAPASSLLQQLELLEAQQQQQQQQQQRLHTTMSDAEDGGASQFLTPITSADGTAATENTAAAAHAAHVGAASAAAAGSPFYQQHHQQQQLQLLQRQQQPQQRGQRVEELQHQQQPPAGQVSQPGTSSKSSPGGSLNTSLRKIFIGSPFNTISEAANTGGTGSSAAEAGQRKDDGDADAAGGQAAGAAPATAAGAITHTATSVMTTIQANLIAVVVKLLLHCGMCFLITTMVALADAAIVTGLHLGAHLPLSVSFAIAVGANLALLVLLLTLLLVVRCMNAANNSRLADAANSPEAQQLDQILETMKAAVQALKNNEQQQQQQQSVLPGVGSASQRFTGSHFLASRTSSMKADLEAGRQGGSGAAGRAGGPLAVAGKIRAVWDAVGRVAGFLPPPQGTQDSEALPGPFGSALQLVGATGGRQQSSTSWGASSGPEGVTTVAGGGSAPLLAPAAPVGARMEGRPGPVALQQQGRHQRVVGTAAPQAVPGSPVAVREAYPQI